jgi:hypothetical protein
MKKRTRIRIRAFSMNFDVEVKRDHYLTMKEATEWVHNEMAPTALIISITHLSLDGDKTILNEHYVDPTAMKVTSVNPEQYLKKPKDEKASKEENSEDEKA